MCKKFPLSLLSGQIDRQMTYRKCEVPVIQSVFTFFAGKARKPLNQTYPTQMPVICMQKQLTLLRLLVTLALAKARPMNVQFQESAQLE